MDFQPMLSSPARQRRFMKNIRWLETSAADHPANLEEGFMVMKTAGSAVDVIAAGLEREAALMQAEDTMLKTMTDYDWSGVDPEIQTAAASLQEFLKKSAEDPDNDGDVDKCPDHPNAKIVDGKCSVCGKPVDDTDDDAGKTPMGKVAATAPDQTNKGARMSARAIARLLGRSARSEDSVQKAEFQPNAALMQAIQQAWPEFCGKAASAAQSGETADVRRQRMVKAASEFVSDVAEGYGVIRWEFGREPVTKADYSDEDRAALAKKGRAIPKRNDKGEVVGGGYPIDNKDDLHKAIQAYGRNPTPTVKAHIKKMAKELGATDMLPDNW